MPPASQLPKAALYHAVDRALTNGRANPVIRNALARLLWTDAHFEDGAALLAECRRLEQRAESARGAQVGATARIRTQGRQANAAVVDLVVVCRDEIDDPEVRHALELDAPRADCRTVAWQQQAERFLAQALTPDGPGAAVQAVGVPRERLVAVQAQVREVAALRALQSRRKSDLQTTTERLQQRRDALRRWLTRFTRRARRALRTSPQHLEALGLTVPTAKEGGRRRVGGEFVRNDGPHD